MSVILETTIGDITVDLHVEQRPRACLNFLKLCKVKYYNYAVFFNVQRDFIAQTGDPTGTGKGGESVFSKLYGDQAAFFEPEKMPPMKHVSVGTLSMANNGHSMHGSQFFVTLSENLTYLDDVHTVFGQVTEGLDVLTTLNETIVDGTNRPYQDIRINHTVILDDPFPDPQGLRVPSRSPSPTPEQLDTGRIAPGESVEEYRGMTAAEIDEAIREKEARAHAQILEMVGDLPDADVAPPDNVLFVCKLNAVTSDEDLFIIFSRFGPIKKCEVIRDQKTGESLQYAFVEFENEDDCASAYFKMDNVLIDDRRIHVDFSQSVSRLDWVKHRGKPNGNVNRNLSGPRQETRQQSSSSRQRSSHNHDRHGPSSSSSKRDGNRRVENQKPNFSASSSARSGDSTRGPTRRPDDSRRQRSPSPRRKSSPHELIHSILGRKRSPKARRRDRSPARMSRSRSRKGGRSKRRSSSSSSSTSASSSSPARRKDLSHRRDERNGSKASRRRRSSSSSDDRRTYRTSKKRRSASRDADRRERSEKSRNYRT
ncbi:hypothetical protein RvY_08765 [Ramazzottius varieornatus]|uniref:Peptidyl-prolyl cis-trans isomerase n=1 Tax=Ramazzottius varieornatus TaxID=947166 RepID=A0A1D1V714_RAMVA|nr:hypothetical protein RvY_08765 [Ramazzottius varieornatus]